MKAAFCLALAIAACSAPPPRPPVPVTLQACPPPVPVPLPPRKPRTVDGIAAWGNRDELALREANRRLAECDTRRADAVRLLESGK